jgi:hypothetical protein
LNGFGILGLLAWDKPFGLFRLSESFPIGSGFSVSDGHRIRWFFAAAEDGIATQGSVNRNFPQR